MQCHMLQYTTHCDVIVTWSKDYAMSYAAIHNSLWRILQLNNRAVFLLGGGRGGGGGCHAVEICLNELCLDAAYCFQSGGQIIVVWTNEPSVGEFHFLANVIGPLFTWCVCDEVDYLTFIWLTRALIPIKSIFVHICIESGKISLLGGGGGVTLCNS